MVIKEFYITRTDGVKLFRNYSDEGKRLLQIETGSVYMEAIDVENAPYTYKEIKDGVDYINGYRTIPEAITEDLAFAKGEKGWWKDELYESLYDNQIWNPDQFTAGWQKIALIPQNEF